MKRNLAAVAAVLAGSLCAGTVRAQDVERTRITTETTTTPSSSLTTQTIDIDYEIDKRRDQGWNSQWGLVFSLNSIFSSFNNTILGGFDGVGAAGFYTFSPQLMLRGGFTLSRSNDPVAVTKTTLESAGVDTATYTVPITPNNSTGFVTSSVGVAAHADVLWRLTRNKVAPYVGGGALLDYGYSRLTFDDDATNPSAITAYRNRTTNVTFGVRGIVGAEWRIHSNFSLFAEYALLVNVLRYNITDNRVTYQDAKDNPTAVTSIHTESNVARWFGVSTTLQQGAQLGVMVFF